MTTPTPHGAPELPKTDLQKLRRFAAGYMHWDGARFFGDVFQLDAYARAAIQQAAGAVPEPQKEGSSDHLVPCAGGGVTQWQPIETAPKDGTDILLANEKAVSPAGWVSDVDHGAEWEGQCGMAGWWTLNGDARPPTHWMPLPPPPTSQINPGSAPREDGHG